MTVIVSRSFAHPPTTCRCLTERSAARSQGEHSLRLQGHSRRQVYIHNHVAKSAGADNVHQERGNTCPKGELRAGVSCVSLIVCPKEASPLYVRRPCCWACCLGRPASVPSVTLRVAYMPSPRSEVDACRVSVTGIVKLRHEAGAAS